MEKQACDLRLALALDCGELLRAFVREAALLEGARAGAASLLAEDARHAWAALCALGPNRENAHVAVVSSRQDIHCRIRLRGHARFASLGAALAPLARRDAGLAVREVGVDGWELSFHRPLSEEFEARPVDAAPPRAPASANTTASFQIDLPKREDAPAIARCFLEVYGHNYVHTEVFSPQRYWRKVEGGELIPVVARNEKGEAIGHVALEREPGAPVAERGEAVVMNAYRGHHLLEQMTERLSQEARRLGLTGVYAVPVTLHTFSQRNDERAGMPVCAVLLGTAPESAHPKGAIAPTAGQRQSYLMTFGFLQAPPARVLCAPAPYRTVMRQIYDSLGVAVSLSDPAPPSATWSKTRISLSGRAVAKIHFDVVGLGAGVELKQAFEDALGLGARAVQLSARVDDPGLPLLVDEARALGFFFCGVGPSFSEGNDILLLQFLVDALDIGKLQLFTQQARDLVAFIDADRARPA